MSGGLSKFGSPLRMYILHIVPHIVNVSIDPKYVSAIAPYIASEQSRQKDMKAKRMNSQGLRI